MSYFRILKDKSDVGITSRNLPIGYENFVCQAFESDTYVFIPETLDRHFSGLRLSLIRQF